MQNQSKREITFDNQLKTALMGLKISVNGLMQTLQGIQDPQLILQRGCYSGQIFMKTFLTVFKTFQHVAPKKMH